MDDAQNTLTEKEKETLRLLVRGHDAKSMARQLNLSVHTINERLRHARRKLGVSSSKEAARLLMEREATHPHFLADEQIGDVFGQESRNPDAVPPIPPSGVGGAARRKAIWIGVFVMSLFLAALAAATFTSNQQAKPAQDTRTSETVVQDNEREAAARSWLALVDASDWKASYNAAGLAFRRPNTVATWRAASEQARAPLGTVKVREAISVEFLNAPPSGYHLVRFKTDFETRDGAIETITLEREGGTFKVVGYFIS